MVELDLAPGAPTSIMHQNVMVGGNTELEDPPGLYERVEYLLSEWVRHFHQPGLLREGDRIYAAYVARVSCLFESVIPFSNWVTFVH